MGKFWITFDSGTPRLGPPELAGADRYVVRAVVSGRLGDKSPELFVVVAESSPEGLQVFVGEQQSLTTAAPSMRGFEQWNERGEFHTFNLKFDINDDFPAGVVCISPAGKTGSSFFDDGQHKHALDVRYNP